MQTYAAVTAAFAWVGQASGQAEFGKEHADLQHVFWIGGAYQVWIPNLTSQYVHEIRTLA
jgi:hypothetical protein